MKKDYKKNILNRRKKIYELQILISNHYLYLIYLPNGNQIILNCINFCGDKQSVKKYCWFFQWHYKTTEKIENYLSKNIILIQFSKR